ncbi:MAG: hypothetical protein JO185_22010 [Acidobacteriaceae bacterium]|nr:hypothetical protein [Acidobacteriaceae bacterium]
MRHFWTAGLICSGLICAQTSASIQINIYNLANVPPSTLHQATKEAGRILAEAGVKIIWEHCLSKTEGGVAGQSDTSVFQPLLPDPRSYLVLYIMHGPPNHIYPTALGFALPKARTGAHATIFYDRVRKLSEFADIDRATMLAHAMAHEIGHVLLRSTEHSPGGIMKAYWSRADCQRAAKGWMGFTALQRVAIQEGAAARLAAGDRK